MGVLRKHEDVSRAELDEDGKERRGAGKEERRSDLAVIFGLDTQRRYPGTLAASFCGGGHELEHRLWRHGREI